VSGFNFPSAPKHSGPTMGQLAVAAGLIQQRQQVGLARQQVRLQQKSLDAQNQANSFAAAQLSEMQKIEENRKKEKLLDVWSAEFQHRGMSPLESHTQALAEMEIMDLIIRFQEYSELYAYQCKNAISRLKTRRKIKVKKKSLILFFISVSPYALLWLSHDPTTPTTRAGIAPIESTPLAILLFGSLFIMVPISVVWILIQVLNSYQTREETSEEQREKATSPYFLEFSSKIQELDLAVSALPPSQLSDDSEFRTMVKSLSGN